MTGNRFNWNRSAPFAELLGIEILRAENGRAEVAFQARPEFTNRKGDIHGGVLSSLIDLAAGIAARSQGEMEGLATITLNVSFLQTARDSIIAEAEVVRAGRSMAFVNVKVLGKDGSVAATGNVTLRIIR